MIDRKPGGGQEWQSGECGMDLTPSLKIPKNKSKAWRVVPQGARVPAVCVAPALICRHELGALPTHPASGFWPKAAHRAWQANPGRVKGRTQKGEKISVLSWAYLTFLPVK